MTAKAIAISVCICTKDRPKSLKRLLESIPNESGYIHEILVSDDGNDQGSREVVEKIGNATWNPGPHLGVSANRNSVALRSGGTHIWFLDDDAVTSRTCLDELVGYLHRAEDIDKTIVSGSVVEKGHRVEAHEQNFLGFQSRAYGTDDRRTTVVLGNALFPRSLFNVVLFDEVLSSVYEEVDFTTRAVARGYTIIDSKDAIARHEPTRTHNRYGSETDIARLYVTSKRRGFTEQRPAKAAIYLCVAVPHMVASRVKRDGLDTLPETIKCIREVVSRLRQHAKHVRLERADASR